MCNQLHDEILAFRGVLYSVQTQLDLLNDFVGFTACPSTTYIDITQNTRIIFSRTITNIGHAYNPSNGSFICPRHGLYLSTIAVWCNQNDIGRIDLIKGDDEIVIRAVAIAGVDTMEGASNTVVLECRAREEIWLKAGSNGRLETLQPSPQTTFSGMVLRYLE